ncbi:MAG: PLP-dependent aminotransferase family protein [Oligoflexia bacterium]|nr:PLP-dependent aminotransferase family protein [Oligoflexia bacterium]
MIDLIKNLAITNRRAKSSVIRELLKLTNKPGVISFAGGLPSPECFPIDQLADITSKVIKEKGHLAFQYGETEGTAELKEEIIKLLKTDEAITIKKENIIITSSSQQGLDLVTKTFIDAADFVITEAPTYIGGLQVFRCYGANIISVPSDDDGLCVSALEKLLNNLISDEEHYKMLYVVPDFQNPKGTTLPFERREQIVKLAAKYNFIILEDSPYRHLRYRGNAPSMLYKLDSLSNTISLFSFSKTLVPGFRLGYIVANAEIIKKFSKLKQSLDLCTSPFIQYITAEFLKQGYFHPHLNKIKSIYEKKLNVMLEALKKYMPEEVTWTSPEGGLFLWATLPEKIDTTEMFNDAIKENVAYVIGSAFHADGGGKNSMRLNFSYPSEVEIDVGIKRLAEVIKKKI